MHFDNGYLYHVYNRGNNSQKIFLRDENYFFFLRKVKKELFPFCDMLACCLMPTHFHFLVYTKEVAAYSPTPIHRMTSSHPMNRSHPMNPNPTPVPAVIHPLNNAIGILLRSYTRAINIQEVRTGSLFQQKTKAKCLDSPLLWKNFPPDRYNYPLVCFNYIHQNPMEAGLVNRMEDWKYSSFREYALKNEEIFCNKQMLFDFIPFFDERNFYELSYPG